MCCLCTLLLLVLFTFFFDYIFLFILFDHMLRFELVIFMFLCCLCVNMVFFLIGDVFCFFSFFVFFFFFKRKTAYEMRISDWSSDVCSSDLGLTAPLHPGAVKYYKEKGWM